MGQDGSVVFKFEDCHVFAQLRTEDVEELQVSVSMPSWNVWVINKGRPLHFNECGRSMGHFPHLVRGETNCRKKKE